jgi:hypothetical protein
LPCGTYLLAANTGLAISNQKVSLVGQNEACVVLRYTGTGNALTVQMNPFTTQPAGEYKNFQIIGTSSGTSGLRSGCIVRGQG